MYLKGEREFYNMLEITCVFDFSFQDCTAPFTVDVFTNGVSDAGAAAENVVNSRGMNIFSTSLRYISIF